MQPKYRAVRKDISMLWTNYIKDVVENNKAVQENDAKECVTGKEKEKGVCDG